MSRPSFGTSICTALLLAVSLPAQPPPRLELPLLSLRNIALDFDAGRNATYCYYGDSDESMERIHVDSVSVVTTAKECDGVGLGFISRLADPTLVIEMLRGVITSHPEFRVVSAFYKTEIIEVDSQKVRTAHALSVIRAAGVTAAKSRS